MAADGQRLFPLETQQFSTNLELLLQQQGSKLRGKVREGFHVGKAASPINQVGAVQSKAPAGRYAPKNRTDADFVRRWVFPVDKEIDQLIDSFDELKTIVDPKSAYVTGASYACGRDWDDEIILQSTSDTSKIGTDTGGLTSEVFSTSNTFQVGVSFGGTNTGLTVAKLIEAKRIFRHYHNDPDTDPMTVVIGSTQESDLLKQAQVTNMDYSDRPVLVDGKVTRFMGFDIVVMERTPVIAANNRGCLAFVRSGIYLGMWKDTTNRVSIRNELSSEPYDLYTQYSYGATRTQLGKVVQIVCYDTIGADITP